MQQSTTLPNIIVVKSQIFKWRCIKAHYTNCSQLSKTSLMEFGPNMQHKVRRFGYKAGYWPEVVKVTSL